MDRKEREILEAKLNERAKNAFNKGSRVLRELTIGDRVTIQNHPMVRKMRWDKMGVVTNIPRAIQYEILVDGSRRLTIRNRQHLWKV